MNVTPQCSNNDQKWRETYLIRVAIVYCGAHSHNRGVLVKVGPIKAECYHIKIIISLHSRAISGNKVALTYCWEGLKARIFRIIG